MSCCCALAKAQALLGLSESRFWRDGTSERETSVGRVCERGTGGGGGVLAEAGFHSMGRAAENIFPKGVVGLNEHYGSTRRESAERGPA